MSRALLALVALFTVGGTGAIGYTVAIGHSRVTRTEGRFPAAPLPEVAASASSGMADATALSQRSEAGTQQASSMAYMEASLSPTISADTVAKWIAEATGDDSELRAAAIIALEAAPRSQAIPVLQKVLKAGEPMDRQLALPSLRALALYQGDADGGIRDTLRQAIYDGGDEAIVQDAKTVLDDVEGDPGRTVPNAHP